MEGEASGVRSLTMSLWYNSICAETYTYCLVNKDKRIQIARCFMVVNFLLNIFHIHIDYQFVGSIKIQMTQSMITIVMLWPTFCLFCIRSASAFISNL